MTDYIVAMPNDTTEFNESWRNVVGSAGYMVANNIFNRLVVTETESLSSFPDLAHHWERLDVPAVGGSSSTSTPAGTTVSASPPTTWPTPTCTRSSTSTTPRASSATWPTSRCSTTTPWSTT